MWRLSQKATLVPLDRPWLPLLENCDHHPQKNEPFSQEMHLKIPPSSQGLKLSNSKPEYRVSALHFFVKLLPPMASCHRAQWDECFFSFLFLDQPLFHCWKANQGLNLLGNLRTLEYDRLHIYRLWYQKVPTYDSRTSVLVCLVLVCRKIK